MKTSRVFFIEHADRRMTRTYPLLCSLAMAKDSKLILVFSGVESFNIASVMKSLGDDKYGITYAPIKLLHILTQITGVINEQVSDFSLLHDASEWRLKGPSTEQMRQILASKVQSLGVCY